MKLGWQGVKNNRVNYEGYYHSLEASGRQNPQLNRLPDINHQLLPAT